MTGNGAITSLCRQPLTTTKSPRMSIPTTQKYHIFRWCCLQRILMPIGSSDCPTYRRCTTTVSIPAQRRPNNKSDNGVRRMCNRLLRSHRYVKRHPPTRLTSRRHRGLRIVPLHVLLVVARVLVVLQHRQDGRRDLLADQRLPVESTKPRVPLELEQTRPPAPETLTRRLDQQHLDEGIARHRRAPGGVVPQIGDVIVNSLIGGSSSENVGRLVTIP